MVSQRSGSGDGRSSRVCRRSARAPRCSASAASGTRTASRRASRGAGCCSIARLAPGRCRDRCRRPVRRGAARLRAGASGRARRWTMTCSADLAGFFRYLVALDQPADRGRVPGRAWRPRCRAARARPGRPARGAAPVPAHALVAGSIGSAWPARPGRKARLEAVPWFIIRPWATRANQRHHPERRRRLATPGRNIGPRAPACRTQALPSISAALGGEAAAASALAVLDQREGEGNDAEAHPGFIQVQPVARPARSAVESADRRIVFRSGETDEITTCPTGTRNGKKRRAERTAPDPSRWG